MQIIKLNAIDSTNDYLKHQQSEKILENFTIVTALEQTNGKGQMGAKWYAEKHKNLIMSVFVKEVISSNEEVFLLNIATSVALKEVLVFFKLDSISIKWPNDIMAGKKKICGILIENVFKHDKSIHSIIGIGLNVNQKDFERLPNATSIINEKHIELNTDEILYKVLEILKNKLDLIKTNQTVLWNEYYEALFLKNKLIAFEDVYGNRFMAIINSISKEGKINLLLENDIVKSFEIKEVRYLY